MNATPSHDADSRRPARTNATRQKLFDASMVLIGERGPANVTVDEIAAAAGVSKGTVYYNFGSKSEMIGQLLEHGVEILEARLGGASVEADDGGTAGGGGGTGDLTADDLTADGGTAGGGGAPAPSPAGGLSANAGAAPGDPVSELERLLGSMLDFFAEYPSFAQLLVSEMWRTPSEWRETLTMLRERLVSIVRRMVERIGRERAVDPEVPPAGVAGAVFGATFIIGLDRQVFHPERTREQALAAVMTVIRGYLR